MVLEVTDQALQYSAVPWRSGSWVTASDLTARFEQNFQGPKLMVEDGRLNTESQRLQQELLRGLALSAFTVTSCNLASM